MAQDDILGDIRTVLGSTAGIESSAVTRETAFTDLGVDSMTLLEVVVGIEDRFGVLIPDDDWSRFTTVGDLADHVERAGAGVLS